MHKNVLLVDTDCAAVKNIDFVLRQDGYDLRSVSCGAEALEALSNRPYNMVISEAVLSDMSGIELCQSIRLQSNVPIIILSAKCEDMDRILGLENGADDYMAKPFNVLELRARMKAILRRTCDRESSLERRVEVNGLVADWGARSLMVKGAPVYLTSREFDLIYVLICDPETVYSREDLYCKVWGTEYIGDLRAIDVHIRRIREKIEEDPSKPTRILTKWGAGYYLAHSSQSGKA